MYCQHCGVELPDGAKFCIECGNPVRENIVINENPVIEYGTIRIRRGNKGAGSAVKVKIFIDGEFVGAVGNGKAIDFTQKCGVHDISLSMSGRDIGSTTVYVHPDVISVCSFELAGFVLNAVFNDPIYQGGSLNRDLPPSIEPVRISLTSQDNTRRCPKCNGPMNIQTVSESRKSGCGTILLYIILALTIFGLLIVIPLMLRKKNETVTYAVCQKCGYKKLLSRR